MNENNPVYSLFRKLNHEVRTPYSTVSSFLNILEMCEYNLSPDELQELCQSLRESINSSLEKLDATLSLAEKSLKADDDESFI